MKVDYKIEKKEGPYITATLTVPYNVFKKTYEDLLKREAEKVDAKGFRKGKVPTEMLDDQVKHMLSLEALEKVVPPYLTELINTEKIELIAPPEYTQLPDLTKEEDLELKVKFTTLPEYKLGDVKKIKVEIEDATVKKEEIDNTISEMFARSALEGKGQKPDDKWAKETASLYKLEDVKDLKGLESEVTKLLQKEKERIVRQNAEHNVMTQAIKLSNIEVPKEAIEFEAREREKAFLNELQNANMTLEDFCKNNNTKIEDLRETWMKDAKEALEADALLKLFGKTTDIKVTDKELEEGIENIKKSRGDQLPENVEKDPIWRNNIKNVIIKQKAYEKLMKEVLKEQKEEVKKKKTNTKNKK